MCQLQPDRVSLSLTVIKKKPTHTNTDCAPLCPQRVANPRASVQKQLVLFLKTAVAGVDWHFVSLWLFLSACPPRGGESWPCSLTEGWWRAQIVEVGAGGQDIHSAALQQHLLEGGGACSQHTPTEQRARPGKSAPRYVAGCR